MSDITKSLGSTKPIPRGDPLRNKIVIARSSLVSDFPFFGFMSLYLQPLETEAIPTAAVTADKKFLVNRKFCESASDSDMKTVIIHEVMHLVSEHSTRIPISAYKTKLNTMRWMWACDIAINFKIFNPEKGAGVPLPSPDFIVPLYNGFEEFWDMSAEQIYRKMISEKYIPKPCQGDSEGEEGSQAKGSTPGVDEQWWDDTAVRCDQATEEQREVWQKIVQESAEYAKGVGKTPGFLEELLTDISKPKKDWRRELQFLVSHHCNKQYDWKRRNRRTIASGIITPGKSPLMPKGVFGMDTSGSMSENSCKTCINEHAGILELAGGEGILGLMDAELYYYGEVNIDSLRKLPAQRGGTDFRPFFERVDKETPVPAYVILASDMYGPFPEKKPDYPVIFLRPEGQAGEPPSGWESCRIIDIPVD